MRFFLIFILLGHCVFFAKSAKILALFPMPGKSHYRMFEPLINKLAERGHHVDVVTHFPSKKPPSRLNQLSLVGSMPIMANNLSINVFDGFTHTDMIHFMVKLLGVDVCAATLQTQVMQDLRKNQSYDLVITEIFGSDCMLGFGHLFKVPTVGLISSISLPWANDRIGNPDNPSYIPNYFLTVTSKMSLFERVKNTAMLLFSKFLYHYYSSKESNKIAKNFFGDDLPTLEELAQNTSLILTNSHYSINYARPTVPNFIEVGGLHIGEINRLKPHLEKILTSNSNGVIYLTMGSMILTETFDFDKIQGLFDAFAELPYQVLWKATKEKFHKDLKFPKNIHFEEWMPQLDILCHPNVKLFVSHGGLMGTQEAVYCGVPRLGIPLFADQVNNIKAAENLGLGLKIEYSEINKENVLKTVRELLNNPKYKNNVQKVSKQFKDRPISALDNAIFWIEYVIRHNGAPELRTAGADLPWYQYLLLDVILVFILLFGTMLLLTFSLVKLVVGFLWCGDKKQKHD